MADRKAIRRALISVYDKTRLVEIGKVLSDAGVEILSTGSTAKNLADAGIAVTEVSAYTGFPEIMGGRVKTLHPRVHSGILADQNNPEHMQAIKDLDIKPFDLVIINLYPFAATIASGGPIQATGPFGDKTINVVDIRDPKAAKDNGVPNSIFGKIAQWSQQQDQTKQGVAEAKSASRRWHDALQREKERRERNERAGQELLNPKKKEEPKEKDMSEGDSGAKYKVRSIGHDAKGDYYISPSTGKKVYKKGVKVGDHENPKTGEHKSVAEGDVNEGWDDIKKFGKKAAVAGAIGLGALGSAQAQDAPSGEDMLPSIVAHVTFKVDGKTISKDINLGTTFKSPGQAGDALAKFLKSKGIKYYDYSLERVKANEPLVTPDEMRASNQEYDRRQNANNLDTSPLTDKGDSKAGRMEPDRGYTSPSRGAQTKDYMSKEGMAEGDSPAMAHTAKSLENPPKVMRHRAKRDQERDKQLQYRNIAKRDEDLDEKIKGADGKACWPGFRYNGTENGSDKCVKIGEAWELEMSNAISKLFENR
jgi:hypothetical protein